MTIAASSSRMTADPPRGSGRIVTAADDARRGGVDSPGHEDMDRHDDHRRAS
jgi:hypothetical protein